MGNGPAANKPHDIVLEAAIRRSARERVQALPEGKRKLGPAKEIIRRHYKTREGAEAAAAVLKAKHGDNVVVHIRELRQQAAPFQLKLSHEWPEQRKPSRKPVANDNHSLREQYNDEMPNHEPGKSGVVQMADPPYSASDAEHYGTCMVNRNKVVKTLANGLPSGALIAWLDQVYPMYSKTQLRTEAVIGIIGSTNHRFRVLSVFRKL